jgi:DNA invertase Pin-like site-specific DNA recombinase
MEFKRCVIYVRVSTEAQSTQASLILQKEVCEAFAKARNLKILKKVSEVGSSYKGTQPILHNLVDSLSNNTILLVYAIDRFSRNVESGLDLIGQIERKNCKLVSVRGESNILEALRSAQKESEILSCRIKDRIQFAIQAGSHIGQAPFGYKISKEIDNLRQIIVRKVSLDPVEQNIITLITMMKNDEDPLSIINMVQEINGFDYDVSDISLDEKGGKGYSPAVIAGFLNGVQIYKRGQDWSEGMVRNILREVESKGILV